MFDLCSDYWENTYTFVRFPMFFNVIFCIVYYTACEDTCFKCKNARLCLIHTVFFFSIPAAHYVCTVPLRLKCYLDLQGCLITIHILGERGKKKTYFTHSFHILWPNCGIFLTGQASHMVPAQDLFVETRLKEENVCSPITYSLCNIGTCIERNTNHTVFM